MDILLIAISVGLLAMMLFWMNQARRWKKKAAYERAATMEMASDMADASHAAWEAGLLAGLRQAEEETISKVLEEV